MNDEQMARIRTHRNNIHRYRRLMQTKLTELERDCVEKRLGEEQSNLERLYPLAQTEFINPLQVELRAQAMTQIFEHHL